MLTGLVTAFVVPPGGFLLLCVVGALAIAVRRRIGIAIGAVGLIGLVLLSLPVVASALLVSLERAPPPSPAVAEAAPKAIVVLGGDIERFGEPPDRGELGPLSLERVRTAARLWRRTHLPILVTGGILAPGTDPVAALMARSLQEDFGVPATWVENRAVDTWDNATRSAAILQVQNIGAVYLVTQPWHMRRGVKAFGRFDIAITPAPTQRDRVASDSFADYLPRASAWLTSYYAFHEWIGCAYYALRG